MYFKIFLFSSVFSAKVTKALPVSFVPLVFMIDNACLRCTFGEAQTHTNVTE